MIYAKLTDYSNPNSLGFRLRDRRIRLVRTIVKSIAEKKGGVRIIDLGGTATYWEIFGFDLLREYGAKVHLVNQDEGGHDYRKSTDLFSYETGDACKLSAHKENSFDFAHSNSVIEHTGGWINMGRFANETRRLARSYYCQVPYFWFPIEPHFGFPFFHWLPEQLRSRLLHRFPLGHSAKRSPSAFQSMSTVQQYQLLDKRQLSALFPDANIMSERFLGLPKSIIAVRHL